MSSFDVFNKYKIYLVPPSIYRIFDFIKVDLWLKKIILRTYFLQKSSRFWRIKKIVNVCFSRNMLKNAANWKPSFSFDAFFEKSQQFQSWLAKSSNVASLNQKYVLGYGKSNTGHVWQGTLRSFFEQQSLNLEQIAIGWILDIRLFIG